LALEHELAKGRSIGDVLVGTFVGDPPETERGDTYYCSTTYREVSTIDLRIAVHRHPHPSTPIHLAANLTALKTSQTSTPIKISCYPTDPIQSNPIQSSKRENLHAAANIALITTAQLHRFLSRLLLSVYTFIYFRKAERERYRLLGDDLLAGRCRRAGRLLHGQGVGVPGVGGGGWGCVFGFEEVDAEHCRGCCK
jgi:hypothetical protein